MKKISYLAFVLVLMFLLVGCDRTPLAVTFQNATMAGSDSNTVKILFSDDKYYESKVYDIWIKSNISNGEFDIHYENQDVFKIVLENEEYWYSLTTLEFESKNKKGKENFKNFKEALNQTLIIESEKECVLTFKAVVGDKFKNAEETGYLISNAEDISKEYSQKITPIKEE